MTDDFAMAWARLEALPVQWWPEVGRMNDGVRWYCELCLGHGEARFIGPAIRAVEATAAAAINKAIDHMHLVGTTNLS